MQLHPMASVSVMRFQALQGIPPAQNSEVSHPTPPFGVEAGGSRRALGMSVKGESIRGMTLAGKDGQGNLFPAFAAVGDFGPPDGGGVQKFADRFRILIVPDEADLERETFHRGKTACIQGMKMFLHRLPPLSIRINVIEVMNFVHRIQKNRDKPAVKPQPSARSFRAFES